MVPARFELSTPRLQSQNSTTELRLSREFRAKKLVASWNNSDWQFLKWIAGTLVKSQFWFFNSFCSTIFLLTNNIYRYTLILVTNWSPRTFTNIELLPILRQWSFNFVRPKVSLVNKTDQAVHYYNVDQGYLFKKILQDYARFCLIL